MEWRIGCSGFHYKEWKEIFYPDKLPQTKWFEYYCRHFNTLELNVTFYRFPRAETLRKWYDQSPADFIFSIKAPKLITHLKVFNDSEKLIEDFYAAIRAGLENKTGAVLFQLPPRLAYSDEVLQKIIKNLDNSFDNVIEFRNESWWTKSVQDELEKNEISFCGISHPKLPNEVVKNNSFLYYRFHGVPVLYKSVYQKEFVQKIANDIRNEGKIKTAYIYFNNTWGTGGITNAKQMQEFISK